MRMRLRLPVVLGGALLSAAALPAVGAQAAACPTGGRTIQRTPDVRLWTSKGHNPKGYMPSPYYACARSTGKVVRLDARGQVENTTVAIAGTMVAYVFTPADSFYRRLYVVNVRTGAIVHDVGLQKGGDAFGEGSTLVGLEVTSRGSAAWTTSIQCYCEGIDPAEDGYQVYEVGASGRRVMLDSGKSVGSALTLADRGRTVVWTRDGAQRRAPLT
jgi:hypothetical protein